MLFVGNIPWELSRGAVTELFEDFHPKLVRMFDKPGTRQHKGFAHVHFEDEGAVDKCAALAALTCTGHWFSSQSSCVTVSHVNCGNMVRLPPSQITCSVELW